MVFCLQRQLIVGLITLAGRSFQVAAPALWNVLPREIRSSTDIGIFKCHVKTHLFKEAFY